MNTIDNRLDILEVRRKAERLSVEADLMELVHTYLDRGREETARTIMDVLERHRAAQR